MEVRRTNVLIAAGALSLLAGCGGSTLGNNNPGGNNGNATPGGVWRGNESVSGLSVVGLVDETGNFNFVRADGVQYVGAATVSGTSIHANVEGIVPRGFVFQDGSGHGTGSISGTIQARSSLSASTTFKTDIGNTSTGTLNLTFDAIYNRAASLTTLSGNFTVAGTSPTVVVTVGSNGQLFSQDAVSGCVLNGNASVINASYNLYKVQFDYANCVGNASALNGVGFTGMATIDTTQSPEQIIMAGTGTSGNVRYSLVLRLNRS
jgi:hypothetical protein